MSRRRGAAAGLALALGAAGVAAAAPLDDHVVAAPGWVEVAAGQRGAVSLVLSPRPGFAVAEVGPVVEVEVVPATGLALDRSRLGRADAVDPRAAAPRFELGLVGASAGTYVITVVVRAWVCGRRTCRPVSDRRRIGVEVVAPADPRLTPAAAPGA